MANENGKKPPGRPPKYDPDRHPRLINVLYADGWTDLEVAEAVGVSRKTLDQWRNRHAELGDAKRSKAEANKIVEKSLYQRAVGLGFEEVTQTIEQDAEGKTVGIKISRTKKQLAPSVTAQIFFLKNRMPRDWHDRHELEITAGDARAEFQSLMGPGANGSGGNNRPTRKPKLLGDGARKDGGVSS